MKRKFQQFPRDFNLFSIIVSANLFQLVVKIGERALHHSGQIGSTLMKRYVKRIRRVRKGTGVILRRFSRNDAGNWTLGVVKRLLIHECPPATAFKFNFRIPLLRR